MSKRMGIGQFFAWDGGCLFIGHHDRELPVHAHQAMQLVVASEGTHRIRPGPDEPYVTYSVAAIPSRHPHGLDVTRSEFGMVILVEPETPEGRAIAGRFVNGGITEIGDDEARATAGALMTAWLAGRREETVAQSRALVSAAAAGLKPAELNDPRIQNAIDYINAHLDGPITLEQVAAHACLSPSRFRHLFAEQTGMGLRPYVLWRRFILVWSHIARGETLSAAAHAAGFADAAHMSRTSVKNFGFAPSGITLEPAPPKRTASAP